jgi:hypothetical protein
MTFGIHFRRRADFAFWRRMVLGFLIVAGASATQVVLADTRESLRSQQLDLLENAVTAVLAQDSELATHVRIERVATPTDSVLKVGYFTVDGKHFGICQVQIWAPGDASLWGRYLPHLTGLYQVAYVEASVAHELTHCREFLSAYDNFEQSSIVAPALRSAVHDLVSLGKVDSRKDQVLWRESLADLGALLYTKEHHPQEYDGIRRTMMGFRLQESQNANHDTSEIIWKATVARLEDESMFAAAVRIRNTLYHVSTETLTGAALAANQ